MTYIKNLTNRKNVEQNVSKAWLLFKRDTLIPQMKPLSYAVRHSDCKIVLVKS